MTDGDVKQGDILTKVQAAIDAHNLDKAVRLILAVKDKNERQRVLFTLACALARDLVRVRGSAHANVKHSDFNRALTNARDRGFDLVLALACGLACEDDFDLDLFSAGVLELELAIACGLAGEEDLKLAIAREAARLDDHDVALADRLARSSITTDRGLFASGLARARDRNIDPVPPNVSINSPPYRSERRDLDLAVGRALASASALDLRLARRIAGHLTMYLDRADYYCSNLSITSSLARDFAGDIDRARDVVKVTKQVVTP